MEELQRVLRHVRRSPVPCKKSCPKPFTRKRLFYEPPFTMRNTQGDRFQLCSNFYYSQGLELFYRISLLNHERPLGRLQLLIHLLISKKEDKVKVHGISTHSEFAPRPQYGKPAEEDRGYGVLPIALEAARALAEDSRISRITIIPSASYKNSYKSLKAYYEKFGFTNFGPDADFLECNELSMQLIH